MRRTFPRWKRFTTIFIAEAYAQGRWEHELPPEQVCVLHTLVVSPAASKKGYGSIVSTELQGLANVSMVLLEKYLG